MEERFISEQSVLQRPKEAFREWKQSVHFTLPLGWQLAQRDMQARYRQTLLGYLWAVLPALGATAAFMLMKSSKILNVGETTIPYPVYVFVGSLFWQLFTTSLSRPIEVVQVNRNVMAKIQFPRLSLLVAALLLVLYDTLIKLCLLPLIFLAFGSWPDADIVYLPLVLLAFIFLGNAIGILLSPLNLIFHDVKIVIPIIMAVLVLLTPVGYVTPETGWLKTIVELNPLTSLIDAARGSLSSMPMPPLMSWGLTGLLSGIFMVVSVVVYLVSLPIIIERQSA